MGTGSGGMGCVRRSRRGWWLHRRFDRRRRNIRPRRNGQCSGLDGSRRPLPGLLQRLEFCDALASLFLLGCKLLLLGRELIELLLRGGELLLLGGKFLHAMMQGADVFRQFFQLPAHIRCNDGRGCDRGWRGCRCDVVGLEVSLPGERASGADQGCHGKSRQDENAVAGFRSVIDDLIVFETGRPRKHADGWLCRLRLAGIAGARIFRSCCFEETTCRSDRMKRGCPASRCARGLSADPSPRDSPLMALPLPHRPRAAVPYPVRASERIQPGKFPRPWHRCTHASPPLKRQNRSSQTLACSVENLERYPWHPPSTI